MANTESVLCPKCGEELLTVATLCGSVFKFSGWKCEACNKYFNLQEQKG